jgi:hypothetical protein
MSEGGRLTNHAVLSELPYISSTLYRAMTSMHVTLLMQNVLTGFFTINLLTDSCRSRKLAVFCISFSMISTLNSSRPKNGFLCPDGRVRMSDGRVRSRTRTTCPSAFTLVFLRFTQLVTIIVSTIKLRSITSSP